MSNKITYNFDDGDNFNFDDTKIEVVGSLAKLLAQTTPGEAVLYAKLDDNKGLVAIDSSGNDNHGAFQGGYTENQWVPGKIGTAIVGISVTNGFINFDQLIEYERTDAFSLECWFRTTSVSTMSFISKQLDSGTFSGFAINILAGKPRLVIRDINSNIISIETNSAYNDGNWHHIVFTYDGSSGVAGCHLYTDNTENNTTVASNTLDSSIKNTADLQVSGRDGNNLCIDSNTELDEAVVYSRELNAAEVSFRWNLGSGTQVLPGAGTSFPTNNPTIISRTKVKATEITTVSATTNVSGLDAIRYVVEVNGIDTWYDGIDWVESSGYSETNTIAEINANLTSLDLTAQGSFVTLKSFLHSDDGSTTPELSQLEIEFDFQIAGAEDINFCTVYWYPKNGDGTICTDVIRFIPSYFNVRYKDEIFICQKILYAEANEISGLLEIDLTENDNMVDINGNDVFYDVYKGDELLGKISVPDQPSALFWDILV